MPKDPADLDLDTLQAVANKLDAIPTMGMNPSAKHLLIDFKTMVSGMMAKCRVPFDEAPTPRDFCPGCRFDCDPTKGQCKLREMEEG
jgi:hypothetical protein